MPEWLTDSVSFTSALPADQMLVRLLVAAVYGGAVAVVYRASHGRHVERAEGWTLTTTLMLLAILIAMVSMVIGDSVARAFSLVGALSIVRFRTVVDDTRDTAFVIFAVIVGMAAGAGLLLVPLIGIPVVGVVAVLLSRASAPTLAAAALDEKLTIRLGLGRDLELLLSPVLRRHLVDYRQVSAATSRKGAALDLSYRVQLNTPAAMTALVTELNQIEGVLEVELEV
jgi:hypothetical protein